MAEPSIKGAGFAETWARLDAMIREGKIQREDVEKWVGDSDLVLDSPPEPSLWYPLAIVDSLTELVAALEGGGGPEYYKTMGRDAFEELLDRATFRSFLESMRSFSQRQGESLVKLAGLVYNFGEWGYSGESPTTFVVEVLDAEPLSAFREWTAAGFVEALMAWVANERVRVLPERPEPGRLLLHGNPAP